MHKSLKFDYDEPTNKFIAAGINAEYVREEQKNAAAWKRVINRNVPLVYMSTENVLLNSYYCQMFRSPRHKENLVGTAVAEALCQDFVSMS